MVFYREKFGGEERPIRSVHEMADFVLRNKREERLKMNDFKDVFGEEEVEADKKLVQELKKKFESQWDSLGEEDKKALKEDKKISEALEIIFADQAESNNWLGPNALLTRTTEFDDFTNQVDAVVEFNVVEFDLEENASQKIALAIDASRKTGTSSIEEKFIKNSGKVTGAVKKRPVVKYFESQISDSKGNFFKGELKSVIPVVIGVEDKNLTRLMEDFNQMIKLKKEKTENAKNALREKLKSMAENPVQMVFLREIELQIKSYMNLIKKETRYKPAVSEENLKKTLEIITAVIDSKRETGLGDLENDAVFAAIKRAAGKSES